MSFINS